MITPRFIPNWEFMTDFLISGSMLTFPGSDSVSVIVQCMFNTDEIMVEAQVCVF